MFDLTDLFTYWDPYYWRNAQQRREAGEEMSFVEALFSFVFGDSDPNSKFEELRWRALGQRLQVGGGTAPLHVDDNAVVFHWRWTDGRIMPVFLGGVADSARRLAFQPAPWRHGASVLVSLAHLSHPAVARLQQLGGVGDPAYHLALQRPLQPASLSPS